MDLININILEELQADAGLSNVELAERICLSPSPCARRIIMHEYKTLFRERVSFLEPFQLRLAVYVFIQMSLDHQVKKSLQQFEDAVNPWRKVMEYYLMTEDLDYLIRVVVPDLAAYHKFLEQALSSYQTDQQALTWAMSAA